MEVIFFNSKISDYLQSLEQSTSTKASRLITLLETFGNKLGMPYSKKILHNLYELRIRGQQEVRIFYCFHQGQAVIVHAFVKKSQKTPLKEIETALLRISLLTTT
jgi:phage-related protein